MTSKITKKEINMDTKTRKLIQVIEAALRATQADSYPRTVYNPGGGDEPWFAVTVDAKDDDQNDQFYCWIEPRDADGLVDEAKELSNEQTFHDAAFDVVLEPWKYRRPQPEVKTNREKEVLEMIDTECEDIWFLNANILLVHSPDNSSWYIHNYITEKISVIYATKEAVCSAYVADSLEWERPPVVDTLRVHLQKISSMKSAKKAAASRKNGKLGGRPRKSVS